MAEPLFFDCLTDAQCWSLFDAGVLHGYLLPVAVYERLVRIAPERGCYLFTWPAGEALPALQDLVVDIAVPVEQPPAPTPGSPLEAPVSVARMRSAIEAFCGRVQPDRPSASRRIHIIALHPRLELRPGPYLEPPARDLTTMSLPELEAYLDAVLRVDEAYDSDAAASSASR